MEMNVYMEISIILFMFVGFSITLAAYKGTRRRVGKIISATCISAISCLIIWRATSLFSYFH